MMLFVYFIGIETNICELLPNEMVRVSLPVITPFTPLTPRVKPRVMQGFLTFNSMNRTFKCNHSLESRGAVLYSGAVFQCYPVCNFGKFINFGYGTVRSERVKR